MGRKQFLFVGGYTEPIQLGTGEIVQGRCRGIGCFEFDAETAGLRWRGWTRGAANPSYLLADPRGPYLYCVNELKEHGGAGGSTVSAYRISPDTGELRLLNRQPSCGTDACHLCLSPDGRYLIASNYGGGSLCALPVRGELGLGGASCLFRHMGAGANPARQEAPHVHQVNVAPGGEFLYATDLGLDRIKCYRADWSAGWLLPAPERDVAGLPGQGLRHAAFGPGGDRIYAMTELSCEVNVYAFDPETGAAELIQRAPCLEGEVGESLGAAIRVHPGGGWLYTSVRGADCLCAFAIGADGRLTLEARVPSEGRTPREIALSPDGRFLLAGNQDSDSIAVFAVGEGGGAPRWLRTQADVPCVTALAFWQ